MAKNKNKYGQYFTIKPVADFMVSLISHHKNSSILEPSCGEGVFLTSLKENGYNNLCAYEIDTSLNNPYSFVRYESFISSPMSDKYDVIIGNPPYVRWKNLEIELKKELEKSPLWNAHFNSLCDYLFIFILKSIEQLNDNGELIFICPEYWITTTHSKSLRDFVIKSGSIVEMYHFKETPLFEGVTSSFVIFKFVKSAKVNNIPLYKYVKKGKPLLLELMRKDCFEKILIPQFQTGKRWILAGKEVQDAIALLEKACMKSAGLFDSHTEMYRIGDFCDIGNGMVSGLDKAFRVENTDELNSEEKATLIRVYKAKDLQQYYNISDSYYFFIKEDISENDFCVKYPNLYNKLQMYKDDLLKRYSYGRTLKIWEFAFPRNETLFSSSQDRILVPCKERISHKKYYRFAMADSSIYPLQDVTAIFRKKSCKEDLYYILAYLNSKEVFEWLKYNGVVKGDVVEFSEAPIASVPFRCIKWDDRQEVECHNDIVRYARDFIKTKDAKKLVLIDERLRKLIYG